jgi:hypothetical protein
MVFMFLLDNIHHHHQQQQQQQRPEADVSHSVPGPPDYMDPNLNGVV